MREDISVALSQSVLAAGVLATLGLGNEYCQNPYSQVDVGVAS